MRRYKANPSRIFSAVEIALAMALSSAGDGLPSHAAIPKLEIVVFSKSVS